MHDALRAGTCGGERYDCCKARFVAYEAVGLVEYYGGDDKDQADEAGEELEDANVAFSLAEVGELGCHGGG